MNRHDKEAIALYVGVMVLIFSIAIGAKVWMSSQEAASYRKFCDTPVTTWDAIFLDLRIDECQCD
jgi:hypothetical protein